MAIWSAFYLWWRYAVTGTLSGPKEAVHALIMGRPEGHLWFMYSLLGLYMATPMIRRFFLPARERDQWQLAFGCLALSTTACLLWTAEARMGWRIPPHPVFVIEWVPYLGYFLIGVLIREVRPSHRGADWGGSGISCDIRNIRRGAGRLGCPRTRLACPRSVLVLCKHVRYDHVYSFLPAHCRRVPEP